MKDKILNKIKEIKKPRNNLSSNVVSIKILTEFGGNIPMVVMEFEATQERDSYHNLVLLNEDHNFKEDLEVVKSEIIEDLKYKLNFIGKSEDKKLKIVDEAILRQEQLLIKLKSHDYVLTKEKSKEKEYFNKIDEQNKLNKLKILKESVKSEGEGSYEAINRDGMREYTYTLKQGLLYPVFYNSCKNTLYPAIDSKKKIYKEEQDALKQEYLDELGGTGTGLFRNVIIAGMVTAFLATLLAMYWGFSYAGDMAKSYDDSEMAKIERAATICQQQITESTVKYRNLLDNYNSCKWDVIKLNNTKIEDKDKSFIEKTLNLN